MNNFQGLFFFLRPVALLYSFFFFFFLNFGVKRKCRDHCQWIFLFVAVEILFWKLETRCVFVCVCFESGPLCCMCVCVCSLYREQTLLHVVTRSGHKATERADIFQLSVSHLLTRLSPRSWRRRLRLRWWKKGRNRGGFVPRPGFFSGGVFFQGRLLCVRCDDWQAGMIMIVLPFHHLDTLNICLCVCLCTPESSIFHLTRSLKLQGELDIHPSSLSKYFNEVLVL